MVAGKWVVEWAVIWILQGLSVQCFLEKMALTALASLGVVFEAVLPSAERGMPKGYGRLNVILCLGCRSCAAIAETDASPLWVFSAVEVRLEACHHVG